MTDTSPVVNPEPPTTVHAGEGTPHIADAVAGLDDSPADGADTLPRPGTRTDPELLLLSLQEERKKRQQVEADRDEAHQRITELESSGLPDAERAAFSDEGKILENRIKNLETSLSEIRTESAKKDILITHPIMKEKWDEFESFRSDPENRGMNLRTAARAFLAENGLVDAPHKGLERPTGGRAPASVGMTAEDVDKLRQTDFKKYRQMVKEGKIKIG